MIACPLCGGSGSQEDSSERCVACRGQGRIEDEGPPPAPAGDQRGYLAKKPCGCAIEWIGYGASGPWVREKLDEWRAKGWQVHDGLQSELVTSCSHPPGGRT